jgi:hypothetical protein
MAEHQNSEVITKSKVEKAISLLKEQKPKERDDVSDREAVQKMRRYIEKLTDSKYGYTYDEVSEMLQGLGIHLSGSRIKYLIGELRKSSRSRQKAEPSDDSSTSENPATETQPKVFANSEAEKSLVNSAKGQSKKQQPAVQEKEDKSVPQSQTNRNAFVPKIYRDEDL